MSKYYIDYDVELKVIESDTDIIEAKSKDEAKRLLRERMKLWHGEEEFVDIKINGIYLTSDDARK